MMGNKRKDQKEFDFDDPKPLPWWATSVIAVLLIYATFATTYFMTKSSVDLTLATLAMNSASTFCAKQRRTHGLSIHVVGDQVNATCYRGVIPITRKLKKVMTKKRSV